MKRLMSIINQDYVSTGNSKISITIRAGLTDLTQDQQPIADDILRVADELLYKAKRSGKNRVVLRA